MNSFFYIIFAVLIKLWIANPVKNSKCSRLLEYSGEYVPSCRLLRRSVNFQTIGHPLHWIIKIRKFNGRWGTESQNSSSCQISWRSVKPLLRYRGLLTFQDGDRPPSLICHTRLDYPRRVFDSLYRFAKFG